MANLLAIPNFVAGANDALATIDVYAKTTRNVVNKIQDIAKLFDVDLTSILKGGDLLAQAFPLIKSIKDGLIQLNPENLVARLTGLAKSIGGAIREMGGEFIDKLVNLDVVKDVYARVDGVISKIKDVSFQSLSAISQMVTDITGDPNLFKIQDKAAAAALFTGLIKEASSKGIANTFKAVVSKITDPQVLNSVIANVLPDTIKSSDIQMLRSIVSSDGNKITKLLDSRLLDKFATGYSFGLGFEPKDVQKAFTEVRETFNLIDPLWNRYKNITSDINVDTVLADVSLITKASKDFKDGLMSYIKQNHTELETEDKLLSLGTVFNTHGVESELKQLFPFQIKFDNTTTKATTFPIQM